MRGYIPKKGEGNNANYPVFAFTYTQHGYLFLRVFHYAIRILKHSALYCKNIIFVSLMYITKYVDNVSILLMAQSIFSYFMQKWVLMITLKTFSIELFIKLEIKEVGSWSELHTNYLSKKSLEFNTQFKYSLRYAFVFCVGDVSPSRHS